MKFLLFAFVALSLALNTGCGEEPTVNEVVRVAVAPASPPNLYIDAGQITGLDLDIFQAYCASRGCKLEITTYSWQGMLDSVVNGQADVAFSGISITEARSQIMEFSVPYMENTWNLVSMIERGIDFRDNLEEMKQYSLGYPRGMAYTDFIASELEPAGIYALSQVRKYPNYNLVLADLQNGNLDLAFLDGTVAFVSAKTLPIQDSYVFSGFDHFGFAFPKGSTLRADFDDFLTNTLGEAGLQEIISSWMN